MTVKKTDLIFRNALLIDGTGAPVRQRGLAVTGERIAARHAPARGCAA